MKLVGVDAAAVFPAQSRTAAAASLTKNMKDLRTHSSDELCTHTHKRADSEQMMRHFLSSRAVRTISTEERNCIGLPYARDLRTCEFTSMKSPCSQSAPTFFFRDVITIENVHVLFLSLCSVP